MSKLFKPHQIGEDETPHLPVILLSKVNDHHVCPIPVKLDTRPVKGFEISPGDDPYPNLMMIASTASGKTTALFHYLKEIVGKLTTIICFVSTIYNDNNWIEIVKYFQKKKIPIVTFMGIKENGQNHLLDLIEDLKAQAEERSRENESSEEEDDPVEVLRKLEGQKPPKKKKEPKEKKLPYQCPDYVIIFDDMAGETNTSSFANFLKMSRHLHVKICVSTQYCKDVLPMGLIQMRQWMLFRGIDEAKLHHCFEAMSNQIPEDLFNQMYEEAVKPTKENPKPFFFAYPIGKDYRICFDTQFKLPDTFEKKLN